LGADIFVSILF